MEQARHHTTGETFLKKPFNLTFKRTNDSIMVDFLGYAYQKVKSDLSGGYWYRFDDSQPVTYHIPFFNSFVPEQQVRLPQAYLIPAEWQTVIQRLKLHGITFYKLKRDTTLELPTYRFKNVHFAPQPFEGRQMVNFELKPILFKRKFVKGSAIVPLKQEAARLIAHLLEPQGPDSFVRWGFFNAIFEQKEYGESYVLEKLARQMLKNDAHLREQFQQKIKNDSAFANNPRAILNWFYQRSPYWDRFKDVYPIGKITTTALLDQILKGATPCE